MKRSEDLTGMKFGLLTVIELDHRKNGHAYYKCKCECGNECVVYSYSLKKGNTKSCGCLKREPADLTGQKFGKLTAIEKVNNEGYWKWQCECGKQKIIKADSVKSGRTRSCGCLRLEDLTGQKFGKLTAIERVNNEGYWKWQCECGKQKIIKADSVKSGRTRSCGCLNGKNQLVIPEGSKYGKLTVIKKVGRNKHNYIMYECKCDCGNTVIVKGSSLHGGTTQSCGCVATEHIKKMQPIAANIGRYAGTKIGIISNNKLNSNNTSGIKGVYYVKSRNKWNASIGFRGKTIHLGQFKNKEDAIEARKKAELKYFKPLIEEYNEIKGDS